MSFPKARQSPKRHFFICSGTPGLLLQKPPFLPALSRLHPHPFCQHMQAHQSCPCLTREITALESSGGLSPTSCFHSTITASQLESKALLLLLLSLENHCLFSSFATRPMPAALPYLKTAPFRTHWPRCEGEGEQDWSSALDKTWV